MPLSKNGAVYQAKWNPNGREFAVCYGFMPSRVRVAVCMSDKQSRETVNDKMELL